MCLVDSLLPVFLCLPYLDVVIKDYYFEVYPRLCVPRSSRDRRPDLTVSVVPSTRFVLFVFSSLWLFPCFVPRREPSCPTVRGSLRRRSRLSPSRGSAAVRGSAIRHSRELTPPFTAQRSRHRGS